MFRRRTLLYAALALAVPLQAFALSGGGAPATNLNAAASLDSCGIASASIVCQIDVSWSAVDGATSYSASVTSPDGSVVDYGSVSGTSTTVYVPYVGNGTYAVTVSAYGTPPGSDTPQIVAKDSATTNGSTATTNGSARDAADASAGVSETPPADSGTDTGTGTDTDTGTGETPSDPPSDPACEHDPATTEPAQSADDSAAAQDETTTTTTPDAEPPDDGCRDAAAGSSASSG
jgi:hypothetical protein